MLLQVLNEFLDCELGLLLLLRRAVAPPLDLHPLCLIKIVLVIVLIVVLLVDFFQQFDLKFFILLSDLVLDCLLIL